MVDPDQSLRHDVCPAEPRGSFIARGARLQSMSKSGRRREPNDQFTAAGDLQPPTRCRSHSFCGVERSDDSYDYGGRVGWCRGGERSAPLCVCNWPIPSAPAWALVSATSEACLRPSSAASSSQTGPACAGRECRWCVIRAVLTRPEGAVPQLQGVWGKLRELAALRGPAPHKVAQRCCRLH